MGQVIAMTEDRCDAVRLLLPWHAAGTSDEGDRALVEQHLAACPACRAELEAERRLAAAVATDRPEVGGGWAAMALALERAELDPPILAASSRAPRASHDRRRWTAPLRHLSGPRRLRWVVAAQFAALLVLGTLIALPDERAGPYRALGDAPASNVRVGNVLAMFRPDATEAAMRRALTASDARLVDGPTGAGAYVLEVPGGANGPALARLRAEPGVTMAEPIGEGAVE